jgi:hypothetical protein
MTESSAVEEMQERFLSVLLQSVRYSIGLDQGFGPVSYPCFESPLSAGAPVDFPPF